MADIFMEYSKDDIDQKFSSLATPENINNINAQLSDEASDSLWKGLNAKVPLGTTLTPCVGDGVTDDTASLQAIVNYVSSLGGGMIFLPPGNYKITSPGIEWKTKVSLSGSGASNSILKGYGINFAVINYDGTWASTTNTYNDCTFRDFEIDCSNMGDGTYRIEEKGIYIQYMVRPKFINMYIHDSPATGYGIDYLQDALFMGCKAYNCGHTWTSGSLGGAGIGIGTGAWAVENITIIGCDTDKSGNYGIFVENQHLAQNYTSKGTRIIGCSATNGLNSGICDKGVDELKVISCRMEGNANKGFETIDAGTGGLVEGCTIRNNVYGVAVNAPITAPYTIRGNYIYGNTKHGLQSNSMQNMTIENNEIYLNGDCGVNITGTHIDLTIQGNKIYNNGTANASGYAQGILLAANITRPRIINNALYDSQATQTQTYGLQLASGYTLTNGNISDNDCISNKTNGMAFSGAMNGTVVNRNNGYDPGGSSVVTPTSSPWTYTASNSDCTLYLVGTGITVNIGGMNVLTGATQVTIPLKSNQTVTITYSTLTSAYYNRL